MSGDVMLKEQYDFIKGIQEYMLEASNMKEDEAWDFGFRIWQFQNWLKGYMDKVQLSPETSTNDTVSKGVFDQVKWERDTALQTLEEHGIGFAERATTSKTETVDTPTNTPTNTPTDLISRQAAIEAMAPFDTNHELRDTLDALPPVEPPKKVVAQIKVDIDEVVKRIKEEYEIKDRPVCEDAISRQEILRAIIICEEVDDDLTTLYEVVEKFPPVEPERPKGEWVAIPYEICGQGEIITDGYIWQCTNCGESKERNTPDMDYCPNCGAKMGGEEE